jgi:carboxymethylenebutenolidase
MRRFVLMLGLLFVHAIAAAEGGQMVTLKSAMGTTLQGYAAGPEEAGRAILLLHDRWGLNGTMRQWADRFAAKGYRVLAIDVFDGRASDKMVLATEIMKSVDPEWIKQDVLAGLKYLAAPRRVIATVGAGLGGWQSFQAAVLAPEQVAASVVLYGAMDASLKEAGKVRSPILAIFANNDPKITMTMVDDYFAALKKSQSTYRFIHVDAGHGFIDPLYPEYNQSRADEVWGEVDLFLAANLGDL